MNTVMDLEECPILLRKWSSLWELPQLPEKIEWEWSSRLKRSLGRAYPKRSLIRLSVLLKKPEYAPLFTEVFCHEAAHLAVYLQHGSSVPLHGSEWKNFVRLAGFEPRRTLSVKTSPATGNDHLVVYQHTCPVCHATRLASRSQPQWRCVSCQQAGLDGRLTITSSPKPGTDKDV